MTNPETNHKRLERNVDRIMAPRMPAPIDVVLLPFQRLLKSEQIGGILLILCTAVALVWANLGGNHSYHDLWESHLRIGFTGFELDMSLHHWINDGLMAIFFFFVGLEIKREVLVGELATARKAALPIAAALGGMVLPAAIYVALNTGQPGASGWGIPMATDIAFSLGILGMIRRGVPPTLPIFLAALAIADDLGAVAVIGFFYTAQISWMHLAVAASVLGLLVLANRLRVRTPLLYALLGVVVWIAVLGSGLHATIAGILVAMTVPTRTRINPAEFLVRGRLLFNEFEHTVETVEENHRSDDFDAIVDALEVSCEQVMTPLGRMEHALSSWVSLLILPLFALANAGVVLSGNISVALLSPVALGVGLGLVLGKSFGIWLFSWLAVKFGLAQLPEGVEWKHLYGAGWLGGIGFTMSLFIAGLAFTDAALLTDAKLGILAGSLIAGVVGAVLLRWAAASPSRAPSL